MDSHYDVVIVGAGPAGAACALSLRDSGLRVLVIDKAVFPRDKVCGDALSIDVLNQLPLLSTSIEKAFITHEAITPSYGVRLYSPDMTKIDIPFVHKGEHKCGYVMRRVDFDNLLVRQLKDEQVEIKEGCSVTTIHRTEDKFSIQTDQGSYSATMIIGADGANSAVRRFVDPNPIDRRHHSAGLRMYYQGVTGFHDKNFIELYFFKSILPGYLWIFPLSNGGANVGIGMLSSAVSRKRVNLKSVLHELLTTHYVLKDRFAAATPMESSKGHGLPLGYVGRTLSSAGVLLVGDAAGLIDPFSGEGIGNAIRSGRIAAAHVQRCFQEQDFSASFNKHYDTVVVRKMGNEFKLSSTIQRLSAYPSLFNFIVRKASKSHYWQGFLTQAMADVEVKKHLARPGFYYRLLFG